MSSATPKPYPVIYDSQQGLQYAFGSGHINIPVLPPLPWAGYVIDAGGQTNVGDLTNTAIIEPIYLSIPVIVTGLCVTISNGNTKHIDMGIYDINLNKIVSTGTKLISDAGNTLRYMLSVPKSLSAGTYYLALIADNDGVTAGSSLGSADFIQTISTTFPLANTLNFSNTPYGIPIKMYLVLQNGLLPNGTVIG